MLKKNTNLLNKLRVKASEKHSRKPVDKPVTLKQESASLVT